MENNLTRYKYGMTEDIAQKRSREFIQFLRNATSSHRADPGPYKPPMGTSNTQPHLVTPNMHFQPGRNINQSVGDEFYGSHIKGYQTGMSGYGELKTQGQRSTGTVILIENFTRGQDSMTTVGIPSTAMTNPQCQMSPTPGHQGISWNGPVYNSKQSCISGQLANYNGQNAVGRFAENRNTQAFTYSHEQLRYHPYSGPTMYGNNKLPEASITNSSRSVSVPPPSLLSPVNGVSVPDMRWNLDSTTPSCKSLMLQDSTQPAKLMFDPSTLQCPNTQPERPYNGQAYATSRNCNVPTTSMLPMLSNNPMQTIHKLPSQPSYNVPIPPMSQTSSVSSMNQLCYASMTNELSHDLNNNLRWHMLQNGNVSEASMQHDFFGNRSTTPAGHSSRTFQSPAMYRTPHATTRTALFPTQFPMVGISQSVKMKASHPAIPEMVQTPLKHRNTPLVKEVVLRLLDLIPLRQPIPFPAWVAAADAIYVELSSCMLWKQLVGLINEMIVSPTGKTVSPALEYRIFGLHETKVYCVLLEFMPVGNDNGCDKLQVYVHPDSPAPGSHWNMITITFEKLRLSNHDSKNYHFIHLKSQTKYQPTIHVLELGHEQQTDWSFALTKTQFIARTTYEDPRVAEMKRNMVSRRHHYNLSLNAAELSSKISALRNDPALTPTNISAYMETRTTYNPTYPTTAQGFMPTQFHCDARQSPVPQDYPQPSTILQQAMAMNPIPPLVTETMPQSSELHRDYSPKLEAANGSEQVLETSNAYNSASSMEGFLPMPYPPEGAWLAGQSASTQLQATVQNSIPPNLVAENTIPTTTANPSVEHVRSGTIHHLPAEANEVHPNISSESGEDTSSHSEVNISGIDPKFWEEIDSILQEADI